MKEKTCLFSLGLAALAMACAHAQAPFYRDASQPLEARVRDLVSRLTLPEKAALMNNASPGVPRLGVPQYNWWNEALHGVARAGNATVFPQAIGLAAMWDAPLLQRIGETIGVEARAKSDESIARGDEVPYHGLTFWSPNINIFRDPRWGRGQETYGEDPCLTAHSGVAFVLGLQGRNPRYLLAAACAKHFAVHSGPEPLRHVFNVDPDPVDLHETYLPAFEALVRQARVAGVMTAYNALYGRPCAVNPLLFGLLREWGFDGYVTSDCHAVEDLFTARKFVAGAPEAEAMAVKAGLCLTCGTQATALVAAVKRGLVSEREIDGRLSSLLRVFFRLGVFDPAQAVPYNAIPFSENESPPHAALALEAAHRSIVLLKNDGLLPLRLRDLRRVAVIGPNAASVPALLGNYNGTPSAPVTVLAGLRAALPAAVGIDYVPGCAYLNPAQGEQPARGDPNTAVPVAGEAFAAAVQAARAADVTVFVGGYTAQIEGEEMPTVYEGMDRGDHTQIELPGPQERLLEAVQATGKPVILVLMSGSAVAVPWADAHVSAILEAWYPGQAGGTALADILLGRTNPSGRLPVTFYRSTADLPAFTDYSMARRTYRYFPGKPLYAFGFGLSFTRFRYSEVRAEAMAESADLFRPALRVSVKVTNAGERAGDEVVQIYACEPAGRPRRPSEALCGFSRVHLAPGQSARVEVPVNAFELRRWDPRRNAYFIPKGAWTFRVGASSADIRESVAATLGR